MGNRHRSAVSLARVLLAALLALVLVAAFAVTASAHRDSAQREGKPLTVMTRNLYLGADLTRAFAALQAPPDR